METKIKECKLRNILQCDKEENIVEVAKNLKNNKERHIIVTDSGKPVGIISTTDINNKVVAENRELKKTKAKDVMTTQIIVKDINESLASAYFEMLKANVFSCPIVDKDRLIGTLDLKEAMNHLVKAKIKENKSKKFAKSS
jgi:CBS domain-containing protein